MAEYTEVLFSVKEGSAGNLGMITLNRPAVLNSLNHDMIHALHAQLKKWEVDESIKAVIIQAVEGRAFCAGGDIRLTYDRARANDPAMTDFFRDEYQLNRYIFHYPKPYIALLNGITMGGGVGISIHGSHRVATDNLLFAMPETGIGFFPDVGGTYFLPRLPGKTGYYLGLTGARIKSDDAVGLGVAQHKVTDTDLPVLVDAIANEVFSTDAAASVTAVIERFASANVASALLDSQQDIDACFAFTSVEEIMSALGACQQEVCQKAAKMLGTKSPTSLKITLRAMKEGEQMDFDACMRQEFRLTYRFLHGHDFLEGIRAVIIDKDQQPAWKPASLADVTPQAIEKYFEPMAEELA